MFTCRFLVVLLSFTCCLAAKTFEIEKLSAAESQHQSILKSEVSERKFQASNLWIKYLKSGSKSLLQASDGQSLIEVVDAETGAKPYCHLVTAKTFVKDFISGNFGRRTDSDATLLQDLRLPNEDSVFEFLTAMCHDLQATGTKRRHKRFIFPGTNWCGKGNRAEFVSDFGVHAEADRCCLEHDGCPYIIEGLSTRYNYFNYRLHTLSYCDCDLKFRQCLKDAGTPTAHTVGRVFFDMMGQDCFDLEREQVCKDRSWWGYCNKWGSDLVAHMKDTPVW